MIVILLIFLLSNSCFVQGTFSFLCLFFIFLVSKITLFKFLKKSTKLIITPIER